ncbi:MAG: hypothetical protein GX241_05845, partial [Ruminococcaceae bacterium]|nr:hypothetical protein [Oscillospiraceae bacterium]
MEELERDIFLKTTLMGFEKKGVMDFIEKIQLENESLKRENQDLNAKLNALLKENEMLRTKIDVFAEGVEKAAQKASETSPVKDVHRLVKEHIEPNGDEVLTEKDFPVQKEPITI